VDHFSWFFFDAPAPTTISAMQRTGGRLLGHKTDGDGGRVTTAFFYRIDEDERKKKDAQ
jgi:hypothetical protein